VLGQGTVRAEKLSVVWRRVGGGGGGGGGGGTVPKQKKFNALR